MIGIRDLIQKTFFIRVNSCQFVVKKIPSLIALPTPIAIEIHKHRTSVHVGQCLQIAGFVGPCLQNNQYMDYIRWT